MKRLATALTLAMMTLFGTTAFARGGGGCFLGPTPVLLANGASVPIAQVAPGMEVLAYLEDGRLTDARVREIFSVQAPGFYGITTRHGRHVEATAEHPFYLGNGVYRASQDLRRGDAVMVVRGRRAFADEVEEIVFHPGEVTAYNLHTDFPNTFVAGGFAVHNKGGGGRGGGGGGGHFGGGGSFGRGGFYYHGAQYSSCMQVLDPVGRAKCLKETHIQDGVLFGWVIAFLSLIFFFPKTRGGKALDVLLSPSSIRPQDEKGRLKLGELASIDAKFRPDDLEALARNAFLTLQECWTTRDYSAMAPLVFDTLRQTHERQIDLMLRAHEINRVEGVVIDGIHFVDVRVAPDHSLEEVTALIEAQATDYYVDDRTQEKLRGDDSLTPFQEFWVFQWHRGKWLLREIDQTGESPAIREPMGKISKQLTTLAVRDSSWDEDKMIELARADSIAIFMCMEQQSTELLADRATPRMLSETQAEIDSLKAKKQDAEFRNICARKVFLTMVRQGTGANGDLFTARVAMHAQRKLLSAGDIVLQDPDVRAFDVLLSYVRVGESFRLDHCAKADR